MRGRMQEQVQVRRRFFLLFVTDLLGLLFWPRRLAPALSSLSIVYSLRRPHHHP